MAIDKIISDEKVQYSINWEAATISAYISTWSKLMNRIENLQNLQIFQ